MRETMFFCRNEGFFGSFIRSSFVNDGVCDCCDGSDEFDVKNVGIDAAVPTQSTKCENTCAAKAEAYRAETEAKLAISRRGLDRRAALQQEGTRKFQEMQQRRSELESRVAEIESQLNGAREDLRTFQDVASASDENGTSAKGEEGEETETKASEESTEQSQQQQEQQAEEEQKQAEETQQQNNDSVLVQWLRNQVGRLAAVKDHLIHNWESYQSEREHGMFFTFISFFSSTFFTVGQNHWKTEEAHGNRCLDVSLIPC
jgi:protein kinase C substrate 80K-H